MSTSSVSKPLTTDASVGSSQSTLRQALETAAGMIALATLLWLVLTQVVAILTFGNGLSAIADPYSEADVIRAAEHYAQYGFLTDGGLPHIVYGSRFPTDGWVTDLYRYPLPSGVYTRYPPLPMLIAGLLEVTVGFQHLWLWRLVPVTCSLLALTYAFFALRKTLNALTSALVLLFVAMAPMTSTFMHALHYQGYAQALFITELALLTRCFFSEEKLSARTLGVVCLIAFIQGSFGFDYLFLTAGAAFPLMLLARAHGRRVDTRTVALIAVASTLSYATAHLLHFWQVVHFYGSLSAAMQDFSSRARFRFSGPADAPYAANLLVVLLAYGRLLWFWPINVHFGPLLAFLSGGVFIGWRGNRTEERFGLRGLSAPRAGGRALIASYGVAAMWLLAMPSHSFIHMHFIPRHFFLPYFVASLDVALRLTAWKAKSPAR